MELVIIGLVLVALWAVYRFSKDIGRKRENEASELKRRIDNEQDPDRKQDLTLLWAKARGVHAHTRRAFKAAITETRSGVSCYNRGVNARLAGDPLSANPFGNRFWGRGKEWYAGWMWADENPDRAKTQRNG
jgi:hypothetical protein